MPGMSRSSRDIQDITAFNNSIAVERMLARFGWLGDPDEILQRAGISRVKLRRVAADDEVAAAIDTRREACINTPWRIEHPSARARRFFTEVLEPHMPELAQQVWNSILYGYNVLELVYRAPDDPANPHPGRMGLAGAIECPFEWFRITPDGRLWWTFGAQEEADQRKFLAVVNDPSLRKPHGEALLAKAYWAWRFRVEGWKLWAQFLERAAKPLLYGKTQSDRELVLEMLKRFSNGPVAVVDIDDELHNLDTPGNSANKFTEFETGCTRRIQRLILGQTLTSGTDGGSGNRALGQVHNEIRQEKRRADIRHVQRAIQRIIDRLAAFNGLEPGRFVMEDGVGLERERAERDKILTDTGQIRFTRRYWEEKYGFEPDDFLMADELPARNDPAQPATPRLAARLSPDGGGDPRPRFTPEQQAIEDEIKRTLDRLASPIDADAIRSAIRGARNEDELRARLAVVLDNADAREFREQLSRALYAADLMGVSHAWRQ